MNRGESSRAGLKTYDATVPCASCGGKVRYVSSGGCPRCLLDRSKYDHCTQILDFHLVPRTRAEAVAVGSKFYRPTQACKHGHRGLRWTRSGTCSICQTASAARIRGGYKQAMRAEGYVVLDVPVPKELEAQIRDYIHWQIEAWRLTCPPAAPPIHVEAARVEIHDWTVDPTR